MTIREQLEEALKKAFVGKRLVWGCISISDGVDNEGDRVMRVADIELLRDVVELCGNEPTASDEKERWYLTYLDAIKLADEGKVQGLDWSGSKERWQTNTFILEEERQ